MSATKRTFKQAFSELADKANTISAIELTELINEFAERDLSDKSVRAHLRKRMRTKDETDDTLKSHQKNAIWRIDYTLAESERKYFDRKSASAS